MNLRETAISEAPGTRQASLSRRFSATFNGFSQRAIVEVATDKHDKYSKMVLFIAMIINNIY